MIIAVIKLHTEVKRTQGEENDNTVERGTKEEVQRMRYKGRKLCCGLYREQQAAAGSGRKVSSGVYSLVQPTTVPP